MRVAASTVTSDAVLPVSELAVRISIVPGLSAGKVNRPEPVRVVAVSSAVAPESRPTL